MDIGAIFLLFATLILVGLFVSRPFLEKESSPAARNAQGDEKTEHERSHYLAEHERILTALQELDFDNALGKIPEEEYPAQRAALMRRGADVLKMLDTLQPEAPTRSVEDRLEAAIAARRLEGNRTSGVTTAAAASEDDLEELIASRRQEREENAAGFCARCGKPVQKSDRFCPKCGAPLQAGQ
jgi:rubrerythrin